MARRPTVTGIIAALVLLVWMGEAWTRHATTMPAGWRQCVADPVAHDGTSLVFPLYTVTAVPGPDRYEISKAQRGIPVAGASAGLMPGTSVSVEGTFRAADRVVVETRREVHRLRPIKQALSALGLLSGLAALPFAFRLRRWGVAERA